MMETERDRAVRLAQELYAQKRREGMDLQSGPCLAEEILPGWCVDIAHSPRSAVDERPENQCSTFRAGRVRHCVEMDPDGNIIRVI